MLYLLKIIYCIPFLAYSCYSDIKTRRVANRVWAIMLAGALPFILYELITKGSEHLKMILISSVLIFSLVYLFFQFGAFGGADAKLLIVLSIIFPEYFAISLFGQQYPLFGFPILGLFTYTVLGNAVLMTAFIPFSLFLYNIYSLRMEEISNPLYLFIGFKMKPKSLKNMHVKLMHEYIPAGEGIKTVYRRTGIPLTDELISELSRMADRGAIEKVWVTPGLPFMLSITAGFAAAVVFGDLVFYMASNIIH